MVTPLTQRRYAEAARRLRLFGGTALDQLNMRTLDKLVVQYMEFLFREAVSEARYLLFGVIFELDLTAKSAEVLPLAKRSLKGSLRERRSRYAIRRPWTWCGRSPLTSSTTLAG